jgi:cephalosporin hydroxylase
MDMWIYQEIISNLRPALIIETGTCFGGSALFLADQCQLNGKGKVITIDIKMPVKPPQHPRLDYITGSSIAESTLTAVRRYVRQAQGHVLVILDSDHKARHVAQELHLYHQFVTPSSYLIVEDTDINRLVRFDHGPGPADAIDGFLPSHKDFVIDKGCEKFYLTFNPGGYLKRVR